MNIQASTRDLAGVVQTIPNYPRRYGSCGSFMICRRESAAKVAPHGRAASHRVPLQTRSRVPLGR